MCRRRSKRSVARIWRRRFLRAAHAAYTLVRAGLTRARHLLARCRTARPPAVEVIGDHPSPRRLARTVAHAARAYARALGVALPQHTTIILVPTVYELGRLHGLLQVVAPATGPERVVLYLASDVDDGPRGSADLLATLRLLVARLVEPATGAPIISVPLTLHSPGFGQRSVAPARVVPLRPTGGSHRNGTVPHAASELNDRLNRFGEPGDDPA